MTPKQRQTLEFIGSFVQATGISPSYEEIGRGIGVPSKSAIHGFVARLIERGYLAREGGVGRARSLPEVALAAVPTAALYTELQRRRATERPHG